jgi:predicted RND superfamily exporter protein
MRPSTLEALLVRLGKFQNRRPLLVVLLVLLSLIPTGFLASRLTLRSAFSELLPDDKRSVIEMRHISERLTSSSTLSVVAQSENVDALKRFVDALSPQLRKLDPKLVTTVDDGTRDVQEFFRAHKHLYAELADIQKTHDDVVDRYDYEVQKKSGMNLGLDDEDKGGADPADIPPPLDAQSIEDKFKKKIDEAQKKQPGTDGYYIGKSKGKTWGAILVRTPLGSMDPRAFELRGQIAELITKINPQQWDPAFTVGYTGNLITAAEGHRAITNDLTQVGAWGIGMILVVVFLFFLRLRVLFCMGLTILVGCTWAFAGAYLSIGYLNTASGFLVSIIAGNGINFGIIYMARYIEARRAGEAIDLAVLTAHRETRTATLAAAAAAMVAYGSLAITNFRGFKHFGVIGGIGMLLCWTVTYLLLPPLLVLTERFRPMFQATPTWRSKARGFYGYPFVWLAKRAPRSIALFGLVSGVLTIAVSVRYFVDDPMEYNLRTVFKTSGKAGQNESTASQLAGRVDDIVGRAGQDGRAIVVDRVDQVEPLVTELLQRRDAAPEGLKPFDKVVTIFDLLPTDQQKKVELLAEIRDRVERGYKRGFVSDKDYEKINEYIPATITPISMADLPEGIARPFIDHEGQRGRIVFIVPTAGESVYNAHYLQRWADAFRETHLPNGDVIYGSGDPVIFADVLQSIRQDAPKAILLSFVGTLAVIFLAFRGRRSGILALSVLVIGLSWLVAFLSLRGIKLNFLNFVALPISVGVGADYALNIMKRRELTSDDEIAKGLVETGGAVVLCSLTTTLGYVALMFSMNGATQSFGLAAAAGEITTVLAAVLFLPAILFWLMKRKQA